MLLSGGAIQNKKQMNIIESVTMTPWEHVSVYVVFQLKVHILNLPGL